jgi:uncharacterized protein YndB with AHSA1/START domain
MESKKDSVTHMHEIYIRASAQAIWDAITDPDWNGKYGYQAVSEYELRPGGKFRALANAQMKEYGLPEVMIDGEVIEVKPPLKLVQTYRWLFNAEHEKEGFTRIAFEIVPSNSGFCRLTVSLPNERNAGAKVFSTPALESNCTGTSANSSGSGT